MKWGRKKPLPSASSSSSTSLPHCSQPSSLISHMFPVSWLSKFKHKNSGNSEPKPRKLNHPKGKWDSPLVNPSKCASFVGDHGNGDGKFYGFDDDEGDAFWRLSFGQDNAEEKSKRVGLGSSVWYFHSDNQRKVPVSSCPNCRRKETGLRSPRSGETARELRSRSRSELHNAEKRSACRYVSPTAATSPGLRTIEEQREDLNLEQTKEEISEDPMSFGWPSLKALGERKSLYVSMEKQRKRTTKQSNSYNNNNRVRAYSPRAETCKVKALEDMKKTKLKMKKKKKKRKDAETGLDSFAVEKSSYDPQKDFKESMVEMILEKKMSRPEELEELLACYLTLNSDDHHDLIIKVFREVWLELGQLQSDKF